MKNLLADDFNTGGSRSDQTYAQEIFESAAMPTNGWIETYYKDLYTTIYLCNLVIENSIQRTVSLKLAILLKLSSIVRFAILN